MIEIIHRMKERPFVLAGVALLLVGLVGGGLFYVDHQKSKEREMVFDENGQKVARAPLPESGEKFEYSFDCRDDKSFSTSYDLGSNALTLTISPDQSYVLPQDVSETGAYYTSIDGQVTFFERDGKARVEINGEVAYENCEASPLKAGA